MRKVRANLNHQFKTFGVFGTLFNVFVNLSNSISGINDKNAGVHKDVLSHSITFCEAKLPVYLSLKDSICPDHYLKAHFLN